jgi:hypothetical protein
MEKWGSYFILFSTKLNILLQKYLSHVSEKNNLPVSYESVVVKA